MTARYALYFAPAPESAWARFGEAWLAQEHPCLREPRRYGFHATLKAPFRLRSGFTLEQLIAALDAVAQSVCAFEVAVLRVSRMDGFYALTPAAPEPRLGRLAEECVRRFDRYRAPLSAAEIARRRRAPLTAREETLLARWGYPFVLDRFRFHLSLTGAIDEQSAPPLPALPAEPLAIDAITLFEEPEPGAALRALHRAAFGRRGRLVYVVGPSGSGKDALIAWARERARASLRVAQRTITRPRQPGGEQHRAVDDVEFAALLAQGAFALHWRANGHRYGIGREIDQWLAEGCTVLVNGSREHLPQARTAYPELEVVHVSAPREVLRARLESRAREAASAVAARLDRRAPVRGAALEIENAGALEDAGARLQAFLASGR